MLFFHILFFIHSFYIMSTCREKKGGGGSLCVFLWSDFGSSQSTIMSLWCFRKKRDRIMSECMHHGRESELILALICLKCDMSVWQQTYAPWGDRTHSTESQAIRRENAFYLVHMKTHFSSLKMDVMFVSYQK
jgi:hypothetical protein